MPASAIGTSRWAGSAAFARCVAKEMRPRGLEPPRACAHQALNLACLPVSPRPQANIDFDIDSLRAKAPWDLSAAEVGALLRLSTPEKIQEYLDRLPYNLEADGDTLRSPRRVLRDATAHCMEGALLAAAALRVAGEPPLIMDLTAVRDEDHVIAPFRRRGRWGAIATSKFSGLRYREPVYRSLRELAMSYFEHYYNLEGERTLRGYGRPVDLARFDWLHWMTAEDDLWPIAEYLGRIRHASLLSPGMARALTAIEQRLRAAGLLGYPDPRRK